MRRGLLSSSKVAENQEHISWMSSVLQHQLSRYMKKEEEEEEEEEEREDEATLIFLVTTLIELLQDQSL